MHIIKNKILSLLDHYFGLIKSKNENLVYATYVAVRRLAMPCADVV